MVRNPREMIRAHTDHVGSLLRPPALLEAQETFAQGAIGADEFKTIEDRAIDHVIALQEGASCEIVTDGELRRLSFQSSFVEAVEGFGAWDLEAFVWGDWHGDSLETWHRPRPTQLGVVGKLHRVRYPYVDEFAYLKSHTQRIAKITMPSPSLFANFWSPERSRDAYPTLDDLLHDVTEIFRSEVAKLVGRGCTYIQLDAPHYPLLVDPKTRAFYERQGWNVEEWLARGIELDNAVIGSHPGVTFGFHLCRGNQGSRWLASGSYEPVAQQIFRNVRAQRLLLEYDDERSGDFQPLRHVPDDKMVILGCVTTKSPRLDSVPTLAARVREAAAFIDLERLGISPQCGFSTSILGNTISEDDQTAKLQHIADTADEIWG